MDLLKVRTNTFQNVQIGSHLKGEKIGEISRKLQVNVIETTGIKGGNGRKDVGYHWCVTCNCSAGKKKSSFFFFSFSSSARPPAAGAVVSVTRRRRGQYPARVLSSTEQPAFNFDPGLPAIDAAAYGALDKNSQISGISVVFPNLTLNSIKIYRIQRAKKLKFCQKNPADYLKLWTS